MATSKIPDVQGNKDIMTILREEVFERIKKNTALREAFLAGFFRVGMELCINKDSRTVELENENSKTLEIISAISEELYGVCPVIKESEKEIRDKVWHTYRLEYSFEEVAELLLGCGITDDEGGFLWDLPPKKYSTSSAAVAYLQGIVLACGYIKIPDWSDESVSKDYQLELRLVSDNALEAVKMLCQRVCRLDENAFSERKSKPIIYTKSAATISDILAGLKAMKSVLYLNEVMARRNLNNKINRQNNVFISNSCKAYDAAIEQITAIKFLKQAGILDSLSDKLKEFSAYRLLNPDYSLEQLAEIIPNTTKSGLNHRARKIMELYRENKDKKN